MISGFSAALSTFLLTSLFAGFAWSEIPRYLDCEEPDAYFSASYSYYENGKNCWREAANQWGSCSFDQNGRHPSSPRCIKISMPARNSSDRDRWEWAFNGISPNIEVWEGFSVKFADNFPCFNGTVGMIYQWKNHSHMPATQLCIGKNSNPNGPLQLYMRVMYGNAYSPTVRESGKTTVPRGEWVDIILHYKVTNGGGGGYLAMWINGTQVYSYYGTIGFSDASASGNPKIGMYYLYAQNYERILWLDEMRWGNSKDDVDPSMDRFSNRVHTPIPSLSAGTYMGPQSITLSSTTPGAAIYYTLNNTDPTQNSTLYTGAIELDHSAILKARGYESGLDESLVTTVGYVIRPYPDGYLVISSVTASADDGNVPQNTIDGDLNTRWSAQGMGQWVTYDLGSVRTVESVWIAWHQGNNRTANFDILVSDNGSDFTNVLASQTSSGTTLEMEEHTFDAAPARYVRIKCDGNSGSDWNSITEVMITGNSNAVVTREAFLSPVQSVSSATAGTVYYTLDGRQIRSRSTLSTASVVVQHTKGRNSQGIRKIVTIPR